MEKQEIIDTCLKEIESRINNTQSAIDSARESANNEQKSTAGDKHDTARAMAQFEQEKLSKQLSEQLKLKELVSRIDLKSTSEKVNVGSLVSCENGLFFLGIGLGKLKVSETEVFCVSAVSPIGKALLGKEKGQIFELNQRKIKVLDVS